MAGGRGLEVDLKAAVEALRRRTHQYQLLSEQAADGVLLVTSGGRLLNANAAASRILGHSRDEILRTHFAELLAADQRGLDPLPLLQLGPGKRATRHGRLRHRDGGTVEAELNATRLPDGRLQVLVRDRTEERRALVNLKEAEERYQRLAEASPDAVFVEADGRIVFANRAAHRLLGREGTLDPHLLLADLIPPEDLEAARDGLGQAQGTGSARVTFRLKRADGRLVATDGAAIAVTYLGLPAVQVVLRDVVEERRVRPRAQETAPPAEAPSLRDGLTGLPGDALVRDRLEVAVAQAYRNRARVGVIAVDLDRFAEVNAAIGQASADRMLRAVARRLGQCVREGDTVARTGGDHFVVLVPGLRHAEDAAKIADKIVRSLRRPFPLRDRVGQATASVGFAVFPDDGEEAGILLAAAEEALGDAQTAGGDRVAPRSGAREEPSLDALELEVGLRAAFGRGNLSMNGTPSQPGILHYQPIYNLATARVVGVEALLRWQHPQLGLVFPQDFLARSDFTGLILAIGPWILRAACLQARAFQRRQRTLRLAVNLSGAEMQRPDLTEVVAETLRETGLPPRTLQIEVPESHVMEDVPRAEKTLRALRDLGVGIVLDRFGLGYASLSRLAQLPADAIKLDLAASHGAAAHADDASLVAAVAAVARSLRLKILAQGVESESQLELLRRLGCDEAQGFLWSPPLPAPSCEKLLK